LDTRGSRKEVGWLKIKNLAATIAVAAVVVVGVAASYMLFVHDDEPFLGTVVFQSNMAGVTATMVGPDDTVRTGLIGESLELSFPGLPEGDYWHICTMQGYSTIGGSGSVSREIGGGTMTFFIDIEVLSAALPVYISTDPSATVIRQGSSGTVTATVASVLDFAGDGLMSCSGLPSGVAAVFTPGTITIALGGEASSTLTLTAGSDAPKGNYFVDLVCSTDQHVNMQIALLLQIS